MKRSVLIMAAAGLFAGFMAAASADAMQLVIYDRVSAPNIAVQEVPGAGAAIEVTNYTRQGVILKIGESAKDLFVEPLSSKRIELDRPGVYSYTLFHNTGPGLNSTVVSATIRGELAVR